MITAANGSRGIQNLYKYIATNVADERMRTTAVRRSSSKTVSCMAWLAAAAAGVYIGEAELSCAFNWSRQHSGEIFHSRHPSSPPRGTSSACAMNQGVPRPRCTACGLPMLAWNCDMKSNQRDTAKAYGFAYGIMTARFYSTLVMISSNRGAIDFHHKILGRTLIHPFLTRPTYNKNFVGNHRLISRRRGITVAT